MAVHVLQPPHTLTTHAAATHTPTTRAIATHAPTTRAPTTHAPTTHAAAMHAQTTRATVTAPPEVAPTCRKMEHEAGQLSLFLLTTPGPGTAYDYQGCIWDS